MLPRVVHFEIQVAAYPEIHPDAHGYALLARKVAGELATLGIR